MAQARRGVFDVDEDAALAELEEAWVPGGYHAFSADGGTWSAISSNGTVLTAPASDQLDQMIRAHWEGMQ
jgi:hypothetical protein